MSRWHHSSCASPVVVVEQNHPTCKSCGNSPDVDALIKAQETRSSIPYLPPDEPRGQYKLWWPPSITYVTEAPDGTRTRVTSPDATDGAGNSGSTKTPISRQHSGIYPESLRSNEFRVLLISAVDDVDYPVHINLETCDDDRHLEYETTSYTWGGENGDSTLCKPVFVGLYWDILLQTQNCWELLRHLRPPRGLRIVWVDAICINQSDMLERETQVAKMGNIYRKASRVVLYLGPDLAPPTSSSSTYPARHELSEFDSLREDLKSRCLQDPSVTLSLSKIFQREYFRRVWVVQELVLSRSITFRVGDVEFVFDSLSRQLNGGTNREIMESPIVPWFKYAAQRYIEGRHGKDLETALDSTCDSFASDPRDNLFGVLGLSRESDPAIVPAYSISFRHVVLGYFAHCLLVNRDVRILDLAAASKRSSTPSWAPPLLSTSIQSQLKSGELTSVRANDNVPKPLPGHGLTCVGYIGKSNNSPWGETQLPKYRKWFYDCVRMVSWLDPDPERVRRYNKMHSIDVCAPQNYDHRCYHFGASLNAESGALNILAVHILSLDQMRTGQIRKSQDGAWYTYTVRFASETRVEMPILDPPWPPYSVWADSLQDNETVVHLRTNVPNLDDLIRTGGIDLFVLYEGSSTIQEHVSGESTPTFCLLRRTRGEDTREFELLAASVDICFHLPFTDSDQQKCTSKEDYFQRMRATPIGFAHNEDGLDLQWAISTIEARRQYLYIRGTWKEVMEGVYAKIRDTWRKTFERSFDERGMRLLQMDRAEYHGLGHTIQNWEPTYALRTYENRPATRYLTMERLRVSRFDLLSDLRQRWVTAQGQTEAGLSAGNIPYFVPLCGRHPWPLFAFPNVTSSRTMFAWFREVAKYTAVTDYLETCGEIAAENSGRRDSGETDSEAKDRRFRRQQDCIREGESELQAGSDALLKSYLDMVHDFQPRTFTGTHQFGITGGWESRKELAVTYVELTFKPEQHHFLSRIIDVIEMASQKIRGEYAHGWFLCFHVRWKRRSSELDELADLNQDFEQSEWDEHGCSGWRAAYECEQHPGETIWITFDWISLLSWALSHEFIGDWKDLKHYCKDGEDAMELMVQGPTEKDREIQASRWPKEFVERLGIDGSTWEVTIV